MDQGVITRLVLGVARLGEADLWGWWGSKGLSAAGEYVLGGAFPRTWVLNALELDVLSAETRHEEGLKRPTALHLFSDQLPFKRLTVNWLLEHKLLGDPDGLAIELRGWDREHARRQLQAWAGVYAPKGEVLGAGLRLAAVSTQELTDPGRLEELARSLTASYVDQGEDMKFPYYDLAK